MSFDFQDDQPRFDREDERKCTNIPALIVCIVFVAVILTAVGYCGMDAKVGRLATPQDDCGNFCGELNTKTLQKCSSYDMRNLPKLLIVSNSSQKCVDKCPNDFRESLNRCFKSGQELESFLAVPQAFAATWYLILLISFIAFVFSYICLLLYRYCPKYVIWIINIGFIIAVLILGMLFLTKTFGEPRPKVAFTCLLLGIISIVALVIYRREIALVAQIFKESSKALMDVPGIMFEPILSFIVLLMSFITFLFFILLIEVSSRDGNSNDKSSPLAISSHILNAIAFIWFTQFIFGCQHFIIAGTVSKWYFTRDKSKLDSPIWQSFVHLVSFHLGSVCMGSILITIMKIVKMIFRTIKNTIDKDSDSGMAQCLACCCMYIIDLIDQALEYLVRNAYIIIALNGSPFIESGKRAFNLLKDNLDQCYSVNQFGDIVLFVCRLLITLIGGLIAYEIMKKPGLHDPTFIPMIVAIIFAFLIAHCFVTVFEMTIDTIFICYCIDIEENDGNDRPYFMSDKLRKVMEELKSSDNDSENLEDGNDPNNMQMQYPAQQVSYGPTDYGQQGPEYPVVQPPFYQPQNYPPQNYPPQQFGPQYYPQSYGQSGYQDPNVIPNYPPQQTGPLPYLPQMGQQIHYLGQQTPFSVQPNYPRYPN